MQSRHIIPCGGLAATNPANDGAEVLPLNLWSGRWDGNDIKLEMGDLHKKLYKAVPMEFRDLLEIAAYVYCADQATRRGGKNVDGFGDDWRRHFVFTIPVRKPGFWNRSEVKDVLRGMLEFLSEDYFDFEFVAGKNAPTMDEYFPNLVKGGPGEGVEGVVLFSGGLDSLAGAIEEGVAQKRRVLLVTHKPTDKLNGVHAALQAGLAAKAGKFAPTHLYVRINKDSDLNRNYTQRTRSFLYAAVGAAVARMQGLDLLRFYENGVVTMNLPVCAQVVGTRATRTTHPRVLAAFENLFSLVAGNRFRVENSFVWDTKADVIKRILKHGCGDLIGASVSCAHTWTYSKEFPHCGTCSQCIDRRVGIVAAGAENFDPAEKYKSDVFTGARPKDEDRMMVATYIERANEIAKLGSVTDLIARYPEAVRMLKFLEGKPVAVAAKVLDLHKRHAAEVNGAIERMLAANAKAVREHGLERDCLLRLSYDSGSGGAAPPAAQPTAERQEERWEEESEGADVYRLWKGDGWWNLVFQGERDVVEADRGVELIEYLLKHPPDEAIHASNLEALVDGRPLIDGAGAIEVDGHPNGNGDADGEMALGGVIQEGAGKKLMGSISLPALKAELAGHRQAMDDPLLPQNERDDARRKLNELLRGHQRGGKVTGAAGRASDRVRKAIKAKIDGWKKLERTKGKPNKVVRSFAAHLEQHLWLPSMGGRGRAGAYGRAGCFTYVPPEGVVWKD
jgi:7-cyano-7-deazaguanine synthase in queuosine biosynthesis